MECHLLLSAHLVSTLSGWVIYLNNYLSCSGRLQKQWDIHVESSPIKGSRIKSIHAEINRNAPYAQLGLIAQYQSLSYCFVLWSHPFILLFHCLICSCCFSSHLLQIRSFFVLILVSNSYFSLYKMTFVILILTIGCIYE